MSMTYPTELPIVPLANPPSATVTVPGSKSITNRALVLAALSNRSLPFRLSGVLRSEDTVVMIDCLRKLRLRVTEYWSGDEWSGEPPLVTVDGDETPPFITADTADLFVGNSGTTVRFLAAMVCLGTGTYRFD